MYSIQSLEVVDMLGDINMLWSSMKIAKERSLVWLIHLAHEQKDSLGSLSPVIHYHLDRSKEENGEALPKLPSEYISFLYNVQSILEARDDVNMECTKNSVNE